MEQLAIKIDAGRNVIVLPTTHEDILSLKDKLSSFRHREWQVQDFGAFGTFEIGFLLIEIDSLQGYHNFNRDSNTPILNMLCAGYPSKQGHTPDCWGQPRTIRQVRVCSDLPTSQERRDGQTHAERPHCPDARELRP